MFVAKKKKMTFSAYETMVGNLGNIGFKPNGFWPTIEQIEQDIVPNIRKNIPFLVWLVEYNDNVSSPENKKVKNYINRLINANIELVYDD